MALDFLLTAFGLVLLLGGGDLMVRGASSLARRLGVSPLAIGLTVVAFGTSAPELAVNVTAAWQGNGAISFGNIFGSNMANIGIIVAAAALVKPLQVQGVVLRREMPMMLLSTAVAAVLGVDALFSGRPSEFDRGDGLALMLLFTVFVYYTIGDFLDQRARRGNHSLAEPQVPSVERLGAALFLTVAGVAGLVIGSQFTVDGAVGLARGFGVPETIIGLTLVAVGTSLPELSASLVASLKGYADIAIGNVVGSNIFNLLLVMGASAAIRPIELPEGGVGDVAVVGLLSLMLWMTSISAGRVIIRAEAAVLFAVYLIYLTGRAIAS